MEKNKAEKKGKKGGRFERFSVSTTRATGTPVAFAIAFIVILVWGATGPLFHFSDGWQLVINTGTGHVTFLMVFLIQQAQDKDTIAVHLKLNELLASSTKADTKLVNAEELSVKELEALKKLYARMNDNDGIKTVADDPGLTGDMDKVP